MTIPTKADHNRTHRFIVPSQRLANPAFPPGSAREIISQRHQPLHGYPSPAGGLLFEGGIRLLIAWKLSRYLTASPSKLRKSGLRGETSVTGWRPAGATALTA
jgi:hypothetical protein